VRAAPRLQHRVDLVHDHDARGLQHLAGALRREQQVERLGRGHQDVRRRAQHRRAFVLGRIAASYRRGDLRAVDAHFLGEGPNLPARLGEVLVDVRGQGLERRDVDHAHFVRQPAFFHALDEELVDGREERSERLPGAGRRRDQRVGAAPDGGPAFGLGGGGLAEAALPPALEDGMEIVG
jgi:hypothetical protein